MSVWVRAHGQSDYIQTNALLDTGSTRTFCSKDLVEQLGIDGSERVLNLETVNGERSSRVVDGQA